MIYTFKQTCKEESDIEYDDGLTILYFNANGSKGGSRDIENMLKYLQDSRNVMAVDEATKELDGYVESVKGNATLKGDYLRNKINEVTDPERLRALLLLAARSQSLEEFEQKMNE